MNPWGKKISRWGVHKSRNTVIVGNIYLPSDQNRDKYVSNCIRTSKVCVLTEDSSRIDNVTIPKNLLNYITFPEKSNILGSQVVLINKPIQNIPFICCVLNNNGEVEIDSENEFILKRFKNGKIIIIQGDLDSGINIQTNAETIDISNTSDDGYININSNNNIVINSKNKIDINSCEELSFKIAKPSENNLITNINYKRGIGFNYSDEFDNQIEIKDGELRIQSPQIIIENKDNYTLKKLMDEIVTEISNSTVATALGTQPLLNKVQILVLKNKIKQILK